MKKEFSIANTAFFQSFEEKAELKLRGKSDNKAKLTYTLYSFDVQGEKTEIYSANIVPSEKGEIEASYSFDPISLAVYKNSVKFRAVLYSEVHDPQLEITEFSIKAVHEAQKSTEEQKPIFNSLTFNEKGEKCVIVQQSNGEIIKVPVVPQKVLFIGNSLLLGMCNTYGMCSTSPTKDYAYQVQKSILEYNKNCRFYKLHGANFEHAESMEAFEKWFSEEKNVYTKLPAKDSFTEDLDLILIQLTDNVNTDDKIKAFNRNVDLFMERLKEMCPKARIIWITGWYNKLNTFDKLLEICERWGLEYVDISELHAKENEAYSGQISWHPEEGEMIVNDAWITHPGDRGMKKIAEQIITTLGI